MNDTSPHSPTSAEPVAPLGGLLLCLAAGPGAWLVQLVVNYALSSHACFPRDTPYLVSPPPGGPGGAVALMAINLVCLVLAGAGIFGAWRYWRASRHEDAGAEQTLLEIGEGRTRFLAAAGLLASGGFAIAILFNTAVLAVVPACWSIPQ